MFGTLLIKECKQILKSMVYYIYVVVFVLFLSSQLGGDITENLQRPQPGQESYGMTNSQKESDIMGKMLAELVLETERNSYATYPMGFYKGVILNETELEKVKAIVEECTGKNWQQVTGEMTEHFNSYDQSSMEGAMQAQVTYSVFPRDGLSYAEFCEHMEEICRLVGAGSSYQKEKWSQGVSVPGTYEQAVEEFEALCTKDRITGAIARLFCDYAGIVLAILPIFLGVTRCLRDKRAQVAQVVYAHKISTAKIIGSRYLANVCMAFLPVIITLLVMQMPYQYHAKTIGVVPDLLAFLKYGCIWLLPEIMVVLAAAFFLTELTENVISIFVQVFWAIASLFSSMTLKGSFGWNLIARWNTLGDTTAFWQQRQELLWNRGFYLILSLVMFVLTIVIYEKKRREGETIYGKIFKRRR